MEAIRQQNTETSNRADLAMKTLALPQMGSAALIGQIALAGQEASAILRCKDTPTKAAFAQLNVERGFIGDRHLSLIGQGADSAALDIITNDAIYAKGQCFTLNRKSMFTADISDQIVALLSKQALSRADIVSQFKLLLQNGEVTSQQLQSFMTRGLGQTNALGNYLESHLEKIAFVECSNADFGLDLSPARSDQDDLALPVDIRIGWGLYDGIAPHQLNYPQGDDNHSVLKRDLIDAVMAATQHLVLNFLTPHDFIHGYIGFEDTETIEEVTKTSTPTVEAITDFMMQHSTDALGELLPGFYHSIIMNNGGSLDDNERTEAIHTWALNLHCLLAMRANSPQEALPQHLTSPLDKPALVAHLRQRIDDAKNEWAVEDADCLETLSAWVEWLNQRVENNLPYVSDDYLSCAEENEYEQPGFEQTVIAFPGCCPDLESTLVDMLFQSFMETGGHTVSTIRHDQPDDMALFLDGTRAISTLIKLIGQL